ncbi:MAG: glycogen debranching enzyme N-terminal domain-containing protein [Candidatus Moduliflexus flocculans]|nr:glycogen debranching enzyme N-terminal domain-containing protein [Candidatus Moduliflexus flocculans]
MVTNGIRGYAAGTVANLLTRRYHGLLIAALQPPLGRTLLLAKLDETIFYAASQATSFCQPLVQWEHRPQWVVFILNNFAWKAPFRHGLLPSPMRY